MCLQGKQKQQHQKGAGMASIIFIAFNLLIIAAIIVSSYLVPIEWLQGIYGVVIVPIVVTIASTMITQTILSAV